MEKVCHVKLFFLEYMTLLAKGEKMVRFLFLFAFFLFDTQASVKGQELVVYSARKEKFVRPLLEKFERETGIKVRPLSGVKVVKILAEQKRPLGNIFISNDVGQLEFLRLKGALRGVAMKQDFGIPKEFKANDHSWISLSARSRILMYNTELISEDEMPKTLWELTDPKWKGQFVITRGGNASMIAHVAALYSFWGREKTLEWVKKIKENAGAITKGHTEIRQSVGRGEFKFGLVNNYYYHLQKLEKKNNRVGAVYPDQEGMGVFTNSAGVAVLNNQKSQGPTDVFMKWVVREENQKLFSQSSLEVPLNRQLRLASPLVGTNHYKVMQVDFNSLGKKWSQTKDLIEEAGLDLAAK